MRQAHLDTLEHMLVAEQDRVRGLQTGHVLEKVLLHQPETVDAPPDRLRKKEKKYVRMKEE